MGMSMKKRKKATDRRSDTAATLISTLLTRAEVAEKEILRLRGLIDRHEQEAEARHSQRATMALREVAGIKHENERLRSTLEGVAKPLEPLIDLCDLLREHLRS
jgi:hypothetical protein